MRLNPRMLLTRNWLTWGRLWGAVLALISVLCVGWGAFELMHKVRPHHWSHVKLGAGPTAQRRSQIAEYFAREALQNDIVVEAVSTEGVEDSIRKVARGELEMAGVSSGLMLPECNDVRLLASLDVAPLHILVRRDIASAHTGLVEMIRGHRVNLGPPGTNDFMLGTDILSFLQLQPNLPNVAGDYAPMHLGKDQLNQLVGELKSLDGAARAARLQELPEVIIALLSLPGPLAQSMLSSGEYTLVPFPYVEPFLMSNLTAQQTAPQTVDRMLVEPTTIHAGMYVSDHSANKESLPTVGLRTVLIAREDMPAETVERIMRTLFESDFTKRIKPHSPLDFPSNFAIHPAAQAYLDRDKPLLTGSFMADISQFFSIFGAFSAGALSLYGFLRRRRIRRPGEYLSEIQQIDAILHPREGDTHYALPPELVKQLDTRLTQLKEQLIRDYCSNRVQGEMVLLSILSSLADSRSQLRVSAERRGGAPPFAGEPEGSSGPRRMGPVALGDLQRAG